MPYLKEFFWFSYAKTDLKLQQKTLLTPQQRYSEMSVAQVIAGTKTFSWGCILGSLSSMKEQRLLPHVAAPASV